MSDLFKANQMCFNIPMIIYTTGSYFGDNDALLNKNGFRSHSAICLQDSQIYSIKTSILMEMTSKLKATEKLMLKIA